MELKIPQPNETLFSEGVSLSCGTDGVLRAERPHGLFAGDTRIVSTYRFALAGQPWQMLSRVRLGAGAMDWSYQSPAIQGPHGALPEGSLLLTLKRRLRGALHDDFVLSSFAPGAVQTRFTLHIDADFADIFEVKEESFATRLNVERVPTRHGVKLLYERHGFSRGVELRFSCSKGGPQVMGSMIVFDLDLRAHEEWSCCAEADPIVGGELFRFSGDPHRPTPDAPPKTHSATTLRAPHILTGAVECALTDLDELAVLRGDGARVPAAGAPWFVTLFGRDTLWVTLMAPLFKPEFAWGTFAALAALQSDRVDDFRDAQPGKFPHEIRTGELAARGVIPHSPYYGTHDAQALFCLALWSAWRWSGDDRLLEEFLPAARRGLMWCDVFGDSDHDGFLEYATRSRHGYFNQGWKDAGDAILHADGQMPELPLALVELQGYWYGARLAIAEMLAHRGESEAANELRHQAAALRRAVEDRYWLEAEGTYAVALDGRKQVLTSIASNAGHLLWNGLPSPERAARVAQRMLASDMFSGWGLRTLSAKHPAYNPIAYQRGSVWPFDTLVCAAGLLRYGHRAAAGLLIRSVLEAAACFENDRLPELFGGTPRSEGYPIPYPKANVPQAWSAAAPLYATQLFLGIVPDAPNGRCYLNPALPDWLPYLELRGIQVGRGTIDVGLAKRDGATRVAFLEARGVEAIMEMPVSTLWGKPYSEPGGGRG